MGENALTFGTGLPAPEIGYHPNVPMDLYRQWDCCSNGRLQEIKRSPAHLRASVLNGRKETDALRFGSAAHMAILEPELFSVRYVAKTRCAAFTGKDERCRSIGSVLLASGDIVCRTHLRDHPINEVVTLLSEEDHKACQEMRAALARKRRAANLVGAAGAFELSIVWDEQVEVRLPEGEVVEVPVRMKGRIDHYSPDLERGTLLDVKTTADASEESFTRAIYAYGYHIQGGLYMRGAKALGLPATHYTILAAEKEPPFEVGVFRLTEGALDAGEQTAMKLLALYARCKHLNDWPGFPDRVRDISLPEWAWRATDDELQRLEEAWGL